MTLERSANWQPPTLDYGGEDILELFAMMFANEVICMICAQAKVFDFPITERIEDVMADQETVQQRLKDRHLYFYEPDGSIFMDYKIMRGDAYLALGTALATDQPNPEESEVLGYRYWHELFQADMTTGEALALARSIVATWGWFE